jgi:hypothetical protein
MRQRALYLMSHTIQQASYLREINSQTVIVTRTLPVNEYLCNAYYLLTVSVGD